MIPGGGGGGGQKQYPQKNFLKKNCKNLKKKKNFFKFFGQTKNY
jgi:hypothetical protein